MPTDLLIDFITPADRPLLVSNRCVIDVFGSVFVVSQIFSFFFYSTKNPYEVFCGILWPYY